MKVYNEKHSNLTPNMQETLANVRRLRNFNVQDYVDAKSRLLNQYFSKSGLNTCVVAISGGIDSAVTLSLVDYASKQPGSPIKNIIAVTIPSFDGSVTNQSDTVKKAEDLCKNLKMKLRILDITSECENLASKVEKQLDKDEIDMWARGQLVSYVRTPSLYYFTSVLNSQGFKPVLVGTINRDEGAYLGYLCKSGDGCVDLQLISDLHKSEVFKVGAALNVPSSILDAVPNGDMYDGRVDEEVFGAPYDFVELFLSYKSMTENTWKSLILNWGEEDKVLFAKYENALEKLHRYNAHKYLGGSTAVHMDVLASAVDGGWIEGVHTTIHKAKNKIQLVRTDKFVGFIDNSPALVEKTPDYSFEKHGEISLVDNILAPEERNNIAAWVNQNAANLVKTNRYGYTSGEEKSGSSRLSFFNEEWANIIFERLMLSGAVNPIFYEPNGSTNWKPYEQWRAIGINPLFRVMKYTNDDVLYPHYDDSFYKSDTQRSLKTVILSVQAADLGGATRFLKDEQLSLPFEKRDFSDKPEITKDDEVIQMFNKEGSALVFNHRILHDGQKIEQGEKIIIRTEIMYERTTF
jgi:NAD+ synthase (glutamine-hydrolysing)